MAVGVPYLVPTSIPTSLRSYVVRRGMVTGCLLLLAACGPAATPAPTSPVLDVPTLSDAGASSSVSGARIHRASPVVGMKWHVEVDADSEWTEPQGGAQHSEYHSRYSAEVVSVDGPTIASVRVRFERNVQHYQGNPKPTSIDGKTYVVSRGDPAVQSKDGGSVPHEEAQRVLDVFPDLGTRSRIDEVLPDEPLAVGDKHDELAVALLRTIHPRVWRLQSGGARVGRVDREEAAFEVHIEAVSDSGVAIDLSGTARIALADARLVLLDLSGGYTPSKAEQPGKFTLRRTSTLEK